MYSLPFRSQGLSGLRALPNSLSYTSLVWPRTLDRSSGLEQRQHQTSRLERLGCQVYIAVSNTLICFVVWAQIMACLTVCRRLHLLTEYLGQYWHFWGHPLFQIVHAGENSGLGRLLFFFSHFIRCHIDYSCAVSINSDYYTCGDFDRLFRPATLA
ncbi:hypothetical protein BS17DRAFT_79285 [Gyrodon lividus]|nr:hypothetical protein BS17DRAFT_79285 [Gyrodon lividus]